MTQINAALFLFLITIIKNFSVTQIWFIDYKHKTIYSSPQVFMQLFQKKTFILFPRTMPQTWGWKMLRMQSAQAWIFGPYCCWLSSKHQFVHKKKAPYALPVSHHEGGEAPLYRPTQGWTVDEACLLCKVIYLLWPSSLGLDGECVLHTHPWRLIEACT